MIKACIFDMDGTTVNSINSIAYFANRALQMNKLGAIPTEDYKYLVGNGASVLVRRMIEHTGGNESDYDSVLNEYNSSYDNDFLYLTEPYDGICELLKELKSMNIKSAILSNKPHSTAQKVSDALFGDENLIDICVGGRKNVPLKPDTTAVFELLDILDVSADECIYLGDTATDMQTGKNSGIFTVGVLWGFRKRDELENSGADRIISHPSELLSIINELNI